MPSIKCQLQIEFSSVKNDNQRGFLHIDSPSLKARIESLGYLMEPRSSGYPPKPYFVCKIVEKEGSDALRSVREAILDTGLVECHRFILPRTLGKTHFAFSKLRVFSQEDINQAPYLRLNVRRTDQRIASFKETGKHGYVIRVDHRLKNSVDFGWLDVVIVPYVSDEGKRLLEREEFHGVQFEPAIFDKPEKATKQLYQLTSSVTMPPCLVPIQNGFGEVVQDESHGLGQYYDDAGYVQPVLKFRKAEVEALEPFDYARTAERVGGMPQHYRHQYIVSQRFRRFLEAKKAHTFDFVPVELVD